jgi:thiamine biosynthesis lipoprotein
MSLEDGMTLVNSLQGVEALWVTEDGEIHYSDNYKDYCYK